MPISEMKPVNNENQSLFRKRLHVDRGTHSYPRTAGSPVNSLWNDLRWKQEYYGAVFSFFPVGHATR